MAQGRKQLSLIYISQRNLIRMARKIHHITQGGPFNDPKNSRSAQFWKIISTTNEPSKVPNPELVFETTSRKRNKLHLDNKYTSKTYLNL